MIVDTLDYKYDYDGVEAYIITVQGNEKSEKMSARCQESCRRVGMPYHVWPAFDGTNKKHILYPDHAKDQDHYRFLKQMNDRLTLGEVACILSHYSLWAHCVKIDRPIVIMEHDAVMFKPYTTHDGMNMINYLGNIDQYREQRFASFPIHASASHNYHFICRAHAYAIDPQVARQLVSHLMRFGLTAPADMIMRTDIFPVVQTDFYAFDAPDGTTIEDRDENWEADAKAIFSTFT